VLKPNGEMQSMSKAGYAYLDGLLKKYGPKRRVKSVELRGKFFTKFDYTSEY